MKRILLVICMLMASALAYAVYQVSYTDMRTENFVVFRQGNLKMAINFTLFNAEGQAIGRSATFDLDKAQQTAVLNFIKPYVQEIALEYDVSPDSWAVAGDKVAVTPTVLDFGTHETGLTFTVSNTGVVAIDWVVTPDHASLSCESSSGSLDGGGEVDVLVTWDRTGLTTGSYSRSIALVSDSGNIDIDVSGIVP